MTSAESAPTDSSRAVRLLIRLIALWVLVVLPFRAVSLGFRPPDDARRHVAKVVSERAWTDVLVLRPEATIDPHPGWHALLGAARAAGVRSAAGLMVLSIVAGAFSVLVAPLLLWRGRDEAWLLALLIVALASWGYFQRVMLGRPFIVSMAALVAVCLLWPRLRGERPAWDTWLALVGVFALSTWIHGNWYLWALPIGCFLLAREVRVARRLAAAAAIGVALGGALTGQPIEFLRQTFLHPVWALGSGTPSRLLVGEFRPSGGAVLMVGAVLALIAWRRLQGGPTRPPLSDPIFLIGFVGWALGLQIMRFWWDWGLPACLVWMARELDAALPAVERSSRRRILLVASIAAMLFLAASADASLRWSKSRPFVRLSEQDPRQREWLPGEGGIVYNTSMDVFYDLFYAYPNAPWRYALGFEPALMPAADLKTYRQIQAAGASDDSLRPWREKLRPQDRLIVDRRGGRPVLPGTEWTSFQSRIWIGRLAREGSVPAAIPAEGDFDQDSDEAATQNGSEIEVEASAAGATH